MTTWYPVERREPPRGNVEYICPCGFPVGNMETPYLRHVGWPISVGVENRSQYEAAAIERREHRNYRCCQGHLWHVMDDGTWFYQGAWEPDPR